MIFVYLYFGKFIVRSFLEFDWSSIPWKQISPMFSAISAMAACMSVIVSVVIASQSRKLSEESNRANIAANKQNNFDNMFFKLLDLLDVNRKDICYIDGMPIYPNDIVVNVKQLIRNKKQNKKYKNLLIYIRKNKDKLFEELVKIENCELDKIQKNRGNNKASFNGNRLLEYSQNIKCVEELSAYAHNEETGKDGNPSTTWAEAIYLKIVKITENTEIPNKVSPEIAELEKIHEVMDLNNNINDIKASFANDQNINNLFENYFEQFRSVLNKYEEITHDEIAGVIKNIYKEVNFGSFFSLVNRITKLIKEQYKDDTEKQNKYVGILRTQIPKELLVCVYYNSEYLPEGKKLQDNLKGLELWGSKDELKHNIHINANMFYNAEKEIDNIIENYTRK